MKPITFSCTETLTLAPEEIAGQILDLANWTGFCVELPPEPQRPLGPV
jgi:hypothetical protein